MDVRNTPLRGGIAGCGFFGQIQLEAWRRIPGVEIVAACDPDLERARRSAPRAYATAEEMLDRERLDFLDIATRPETHLDLVRLGASRGAAMICQKPLAPSWTEAVELVETAERAGVRLMVHENWRWQPWYRVVKDVIERGGIGAPVTYSLRMRMRDGAGPEPYARQPYFRHMPRLVIYETMVHYIDVARFLFGDIVRVYAQSRRVNPVIAGEDHALLLLTHAGGLQGAADGHRFLNAEPDGPVMGEAVFEGGEGYLRVLGSGDVYLGGRIVWANQVTEGYRGDSVRATQSHFIGCLRGGAPFETGGRAYLNTFGAAEAAYLSIAEARAIDLPLP